MPIHLVLPLVFLVFVLGIFYLMTRGRQIMLKVSIALFLFSGIVVFLLYTLSYASYDSGLANTLHAVLRGFFGTARMLVIEHDHEALVDLQGAQWFTESIWLQNLFWFCHVLALIVIQAALIALFGRKLIDKFRMRFGLHREVYMIKGNEKNAFLLGENIASNDNPRQPLDVSRLVVFLIGEEDDAEKIYDTISSFGGVVQILDGNNDFRACLEKAGMGKRSRRRKKFKIVLMPSVISASDDAYRIVIFAKEKAVRPEDLEIFVLPSSEWDREEIEAITQKKEGEKRAYPYTFHITHDIDLITRQMIKMHPPSECHALKFNEIGVASHNFTVMILGFGAVGQSAFLHLAMNGQFVGSRMHAIIVDKDVDLLRDPFLHRRPGLKLCCEMEFMGYDVRSAKFFELLKEIDRADYIVVALDSDEMNKKTAIDIRLHYERAGAGIFPFIAVYEKSGGSQDETQFENIFCFGGQEDLYKESVIIRNEADLLAKAVNDAYTGGKQPWQDLDWFTQESNRAAADFIPSMLKLAKLDEKEAMVKDNLTDDGTIAEILAQTEHLRWIAFKAAMGYLPMSLEEMNRRFENYGGKKNSREHLDFCRRDSNTRVHVCLAAWDELDEISEAYRELARRAGNLKERERDFKNNDRDIIENIPKFLRAAKEQRAPTGVFSKRRTSKRGEIIW